MTRDEAVAASAGFPFGKRLFSAWTSEDALNGLFPKSLADLRAGGGRDEAWLLERGPSACALNNNLTRLTFAGGRLRKITDELGYTGP